MRTTLNLDDALVERARQSTGIQQKTALIHKALEELIRMAAARRLAAAGGAMPDLEMPRRRRSIRAS